MAEGRREGLDEPETERMHGPLCRWHHGPAHLEQDGPCASTGPPQSIQGLSVRRNQRDRRSQSHS